MSRDLNDLDSAFHDQVTKLLENCKQRGFEMRPFFCNTARMRRSMLSSAMTVKILA